MASFLNPSFETQGDWTFEDDAAIYDIGPPYSHTGVGFAFIRAYFFPGGPGPARPVYGAVRQIVSEPIGSVLIPSAWVAGIEQASGRFSIDYRDAAAPGWSRLAEVDSSTLDWAGGTHTEVVASTPALVAGADPEFRFIVEYLGVGLNPFSVAVDDAALAVGETTMAFFWVELPARAMLAMLQANLNTEIGYVQAERNDGVVLPTPARWYCWDRGMPSNNDGNLEISVFERQGSAEFPAFSREAGAFAAGTRSRLSHEVELIVRAEFPNRTQRKTSEMVVVGWRVTAAILRCLRNNPAIGYPTVCNAQPGQPVMTPLPPDSEGRVGNWCRVEVPVHVQTQESPAGETQSSGGVPPVAILES